MTTLQVAVVGSGPAGIYTAEALIKQAAKLDPPATVQVDVLDRLPTPYGLVRYGVAPDHPSIRSIADYLRNVLEHADVSFLGGVHLGNDVTRDDVLASYDAVVYATGAMRDRRMGIPGEDLPGSYAATDFVNWYCGHPDAEAGAFTLDAESVAVVGVGNVAVDVARILVRDPAELRRTDIPQAVLEALMASKVREVHMIGRRGPAQAKFTTKELRELGELSGVEMVVHQDEIDLGAFDPTGQSGELAESDRRVRGNLTVIRDWAGRPARGGAGAERRLTVRFWLRPVSVEGADRVSGLTVERTRLDDQGKFTGTGEFETIPAQMVFRSVGYQSVPLPGVPFDERSYTVPNADGRVLGPDGAPLPGEYVAGWLKRGPTGVVGTNKSDAAGTVRSLLADLAGPDAPATSGRAAARRQSRDDFVAHLAGRGVRPVSYADWLRVEQAEAELGVSLGRGERVKIGDRIALEALCRPPAG
ncbi:MAG TPA: FAD-dependent oxidoreductase [Streptosporangiaceae bacterium]